MQSKELAVKISNELKQYPVFAQSIIKTVCDTLRNEVKEGKVLLSELFESEEMFVNTVTDIIDIETNTGLADLIDRPFIKSAVERLIVPALKKVFGADYLEDLRKIIE